MSRLGRTRRFGHLRIGAVIALALAAAFIAWLFVRHNGQSRVSTTTGAAAPLAARGPVAISVKDLRDFAASVDHPVYWLGPKPGDIYELTETTTGKIYIRYLPPGVKVGINKPFLTVATYPYAHAFTALKALVKASTEVIKLAQGGIGLVDKAYPKSVHVAFPGLNYQVEVFDPSPSVSRQIVVSGQVVPIGG
jgi:hypothetical protein